MRQQFLKCGRPGKKEKQEGGKGAGVKNAQADLRKKMETLEIKRCSVGSLSGQPKPSTASERWPGDNPRSNRAPQVQDRQGDKHSSACIKHEF
jgi:hypothetical protein